MENKISQAESNLQRKLEWISRFDSRISFVTGISITMLGVLVTASTAIDQWQCLNYISFCLAGLLLCISLILVYLSQYPKTESANTSLIYFGTIATMNLDEFKTRFRSATDEEYLDDLLSQIHINAEILCQKFKHLKGALILILFSVLPWLIFIFHSKAFVR